MIFLLVKNLTVLKNIVGNIIDKSLYPEYSLVSGTIAKYLEHSHLSRTLVGTRNTRKVPGTLACIRNTRWYPEHLQSIWNTLMYPEHSRVYNIRVFRIQQRVFRIQYSQGKYGIHKNKTRPHATKKGKQLLF